MTQRYSEAEKEQAVRAVRQLPRELGTDHGTVKRVADQLGIGVESLRKWVEPAEVDDGEPGCSSEDAAQIKALQPRNRDLERANQIAEGVGVFRPGGARPPIDVIVGFIDEHRDELRCSATGERGTESGVTRAR